jgi:peptidoglycan/xylan/chitin deacetylase (PgdA/CDA1 family)
MLERFDLETYAALLERLRADRPIVGFPEALEMPDQPYALVRHDVDFSPEAALRMARLEAELGVKATYFLLLECPWYALLTAPHNELPRQLVELGHEVGLHYAADIFDPLDEAAGIAAMEAQAALLSALSGEPVRVVARHHPSLGGAPPPVAPGVIDAYDARFTTDIEYVSDSCGAWRDATVALFGADELPPRIQLLVHPLFWTAAGTDRWTLLEQLRAERSEVVEADIARLRGFWGAHAGVQEHDARYAPNAASP